MIFVAFTMVFIAIKIRELKAGDTDNDVPARGAAIIAFILFSLDLFFFTISFLLYYADTNDEVGFGFWFCIGFSVTIVSLSFFLMCYHYFVATRYVGPRHKVEK
jgi:hypothetical protein